MTADPGCNRCSTLVLSALTLFLSSDAAAQRPVQDSVVPLPPIEVISSILPYARSSIGSGVPARVVSVEGNELARNAPRLLPDALAGVPGISGYDDLGSAYKTTMVMRGFTAGPVVGLPQGVSVFIDGVPVNEPDAGQVNFDLLPLQHLLRVEVLNGSASLLGPHTIAGAINLVTRRGGGPLTGELVVGAGSYGQRSIGGSIGGTAGEWSYYAGGGHERERGWRQLTEAMRTQLFASIGRLGAARGIRLQVHGARSNAETAGSLPRSVFLERPDSNLSAGDFEDVRQAQATLSAWLPLGAGRAALRVFARGSDAERFNVNQVNDPDVRSFSENRSLGAAVDWRWAAHSAAGALTMRLGATGALHRTTVRIFAERIGAGLTTHVDAPIRDGALYATADATRGPVTVSVSGRLDAVQVPFRNRLDPARDTTSTFVRLGPRVGVSIAATPTISVYASAGQSFRAPAVIELACADPEQPCPLPFALGDDPPLDPVIATTYEAGVRWSALGASLGASLYTTRVRNEIFLLPYDDAAAPEQSTTDGYFANLARTQRSGLELDGSYAMRAGHRLSAAYAYTRALFDIGGIELFSIRDDAGGRNEIEAGDRLPLIPDHTVTVSGDAVLSEGMSLGGDVRLIGERRLRGDEANEEAPLRPFTVVRLRARWGTGPWALSAVIDNVLDNDYASFGTFNFNQGAGGALERFLSPGEPRTVRVTLRRELGG